MSWSIEEHIGECRPFPAQVVVYRGETDECLAYVSGEVADRLKAENERLREEIAKARDPQRIGGQADPSSFVYAIEQLREFRWQHATNDEDAIPYINNVAAAHERENAKLRNQLEEQRCFAADLEKDVRALRELADAVKEFVEDTHCEDCPCRRDCDDNNRVFCVNDFSYHAFAAMRKLGIEVDG